MHISLGADFVVAVTVIFTGSRYGALFSPVSSSDSSSQKCHSVGTHSVAPQRHMALQGQRKG